jgi:hypothetical protein
MAMSADLGAIKASNQQWSVNRFDMQAYLTVLSQKVGGIYMGLYFRTLDLQVTSPDGWLTLGRETCKISLAAPSLQFMQAILSDAHRHALSHDLYCRLGPLVREHRVRQHTAPRQSSQRRQSDLKRPQEVQRA